MSTVRTEPGNRIGNRGPGAGLATEPPHLFSDIEIQQPDSAPGGPLSQAGRMSARRLRFGCFSLASFPFHPKAVEYFGAGQEYRAGAGEEQQLAAPSRKPGEIG